MAAVRCPQCSHVFRPTDDEEAAVCPSCGHRGKLAERFPVAEDEAPVVREPWTPPAEIMGKPRRTWKVLLYTVLTLGFYRAVYRHRAFRELDEQHGLRHHFLLHAWAVSLWLLGTLGAIAYGIVLYLKEEALYGFENATLPVEGLYAILGFLVLPLILGIVYSVLEMRRLQAFRVGRGMRPGIGAGGYYAWIFLVPVLGWFVSIALVNRSVRRVWRKVYEERKLRFPWNA